MIQWQKMAMLGTSISDTFIDFTKSDISKKEFLDFLRTSYISSFYPHEITNAIREIRIMPVRLARRKVNRAMRKLYTY